MNKSFFGAGAAVLALFALLCPVPATAMTIKEFRKFSQTEQGTYIGAAVSMLSYSYAVNGDPAKARCIQNWYFGKKGVETPRQHEITCGDGHSREAWRREISGGRRDSRADGQGLRGS
jgi:hypothetical protein